MLKFREIGTYKNAVNVGYCTADVELSIELQRKLLFLLMEKKQGLQLL